jgi:PilZ domain
MLLAVPAERDFRSIWFRRSAEYPDLVSMTTETQRGTRQHERISLPKGMTVAWYGGGQQQVSRVRSLSMGGLFLCGSITLRVGSELTVVFEVPGGMVLAEAVVRNTLPGDGMGVEFTKMNPQSQALLAELLTRLLR